MLFYQTAAAAQAAGFRPCLRCRPEAAPDMAAWRGTSNTISRALSLIEGGALDQRRVGRLAWQLGVGERHLRRLFCAHLGASTDAVAQTRRVLLAMQLIRDTQLSMADVALAASFVSVRRFNEVFQQLFRRPPGALRRDRSTQDLSQAQALVMRLPYCPPYDWQSVTSFLKARAIPGIEAVSDLRYVRSVGFDGSHGVVAVEPAARDALQVTIRFPRLSQLPAILDRVRRVFDVGADPHAIDAHLASDSALAPLVRDRPGLRVPGAWDGFELAVHAVLGQQISVRAAARLAGRLAQGYGELLEDAFGGTRGADPRVSTSGSHPSVDLAPLGLPRARAKALSSLASAIARDPRILDVGRSLADCVNHLAALPGIGEWTAQYIAMRELREPDAFPASDLWLRRALAGIEGRPFTARELVDRAERWRPWRAYAAQHLWSAAASTQNVGAPSRNQIGHSVARLASDG